LARGEDLVLVIDVQGARQVRRSAFEHVGIFVLPPSFDVLSSRLRSRSKDSDTQIERRLEVARQEVSAVSEYDYVVINDELDPAVRRLQAIVEAERLRLRTMRDKADAIIRTFARQTSCL
jgi:guanylate kinase